MSGDVEVPLLASRDRSGRVLRLLLDVFVVPPLQRDFRSKKVAAVIDTGAMRSSVPPHIIDYFDRNIGRALLMYDKPSRFTVADGTVGFAPRFLFDFIISVPADPSCGRAGFEVTTKPANRGPTVPQCFELPLRSPPHATSPSSAAASQPGSDDCVIFGMDLLHRWKLHIDGPANRFSLTICHA